MLSVRVRSSIPGSVATLIVASIGAASVSVGKPAAQPVKVTIAKASGGDPVDARSILSVLALDARGGDEIVLAADGDGADQALDELAALVARDLDSEA